ncbi:MAG: threonine synthase [Ruminococcaceae bacterium]|nr:threonine synthase [Oscillospiraceae bacterium]
MNYRSTRNINQDAVSAAQAIKQGLCNDGGLFMPESIPALTLDDVKALSTKSYAERAAYILSLFLTDYTYEELLADCSEAYSDKRFKGGAAPLATLNDNTSVLELWHGPTSAFKDMALQIMPRLLSRALTKTGEERTAFILVATSGDTGKAALEGYCDVDKVKITVFYPVDGVSRVQKLQMATQKGGNVFVCAVKGNFDDAQNGVKKIFSDKTMAQKLDANGYFLSSANSINWGRLAPQIAYYVSAYCDLVAEGKIALGDKMNVCVPTGNFGNIFAAYIAKRMGLPVNKFVCASNKNNILTTFLNEGTYDRNRDFYTTMSPSMDILISSNLERLLYLLGGSERTAAYMKDLTEKGVYTVDADIKAKLDAEFAGYYADEAECAETIKTTFADGYLCDTHTAVAVCAAKKYQEESGDDTYMVVASTASPYKFAADVYKSIKDDADFADDYEALPCLNELSGVEIPEGLATLLSKEVRFEKVIEADAMPEEVLSELGIQ